MSNFAVSYNQVQQYLNHIEAIDYFFAKEIQMALLINTELTEQEQEILFHLLTALSASLREGHTCLPITQISNTQWGLALDEQGNISHQGFLFPSVEALNALLLALNINCQANQPVVFDQKCLYIRRYFLFERELTQSIQARLSQKSKSPCNDIANIVSLLFPCEKAPNNALDLDWQKIAVANAINKNFTVIAGGPGTGKTYTVTKLLAALVMLHGKMEHESSSSSLNIALVAPTGKAAQRLSESIINAINGFKGLIDDEILLAIPTQAKTIHRLLGVIPNNPNFRYNKDNLLPCDVLLIDEVSMVDLPMMTRIFRALKPETKVILLGDADQLPSVAVGSVLADIAPRPHPGYSKENNDYLNNVCELGEPLLKQAFEPIQETPNTHSDYLSFLKKSRRFDGEGGIGQLATQVIQGQANKSWQLLASSVSESELLNEEKQLTLVDHTLEDWLLPLINTYYQGIYQCDDIGNAFELLAKFRVLCVTRQGEFGVDALNQWIKEHLLSRYQLTEETYHGMPIMISENDYRLGLYNGDIGLIWRTHDGHLMAYFESSEENNCYRTFIPSRLPKYDAVYAMTIHKTQGSEFDHVTIILPKQADHQLLSRELIYTGITRAKTQLTIASIKQTWSNTVKTAIKRYSGLTL